MVKVTFIDAEGTLYESDVRPGDSAMRAAVNQSVPGLPGECGGLMACATCHVYVPEEWQEKVGPPSAYEKDMLELTPHPTSSSRLSCQIRLRPDLDGLVLQVPDGR